MSINGVQGGANGLVMTPVVMYGVPGVFVALPTTTRVCERAWPMVTGATQYAHGMAVTAVLADGVPGIFMAASEANAPPNIATGITSGTHNANPFVTPDGTHGNMTPPMAMHGLYNTYGSPVAQQCAPPDSPMGPVTTSGVHDIKMTQPKGPEGNPTSDDNGGGHEQD